MMRVRNRRRKPASDGGTRRPGDASIATGEEARADPTKPDCNDAGKAADNPEHERISTNLRKPRTIGTWNVQGLNAGKLEIVLNRMEEQRISILGISETWWLDQGRFTAENGYTVVYSGKDSGKREHGVGIILDKSTAKSFMGFNPVSDRIITVRLEGHPLNITVVQVYAPTSTASEEVMEDFYGQLQDTLDRIPSKDMLLVIGDWNAKIGHCHTKSKIIGNFGLGERNERGDRLEDFCQANDMIVGNTFFQHHPRRLWTWKSPGNLVKNQIDYILIKRRWRSALLNVRTRPSADCGSDHQLLVANIKLKLKARKKGKPIS